MGNIKESVIPYAKKHFKLAQLSFDRYGALSPTENKQSSDTSDSNIIEDIKKLDGDTKSEEQEKGNGTTSNNELENKKPKTTDRTLITLNILYFPTKIINPCMIYVLHRKQHFL